ncbi:hypothetical protein [Spirosoma flavum]|uniref:Phage protein n=1 Tax=Spirosoma flavum TaxID=2048557 RepID=A0ABW6AII0_9BACT
MAQHWINKASVQAAIANALVGIIPATFVAIAAILVQINYANKQIALSDSVSIKQEIKDSLTWVRVKKQYSSDSLLAIKDLELNRLQIELATRKREDDIAQGNTLAEINRNQLKVFEAQLKIVNDNNRIQVLKNLNLFGSNLKKYGEIINSIDFVRRFDNDDIKSIHYVLSFLQNQSTNPILFENPDMLRKFHLEIYQINSYIGLANHIKDTLQYDNLYHDYETEKRVENNEIRVFYLKQKQFYESKLYKYLKIKSGQKVINDKIETQW